MLRKLPVEFEKKTQVNWEQFLKSLGGEFGLVVTLNESNNIPIPLPSGRIQIPEPGLLIVVKVNDDTIFNRLDTELKKNPMGVSVDKTELKMRTMPVPLPLPIKSSSHDRQQRRLSVHRFIRCAGGRGIGRGKAGKNPA
ncbi:MAG: hypothetical protein WDM76_14055 [Limisphaerales bacterium]